MQKLGIRNIDIHNATGASKSSVNLWINGGRDPSAKFLVKLAKVLQCKVDWLVFGVDNSESEDCISKFELLTASQKTVICDQIQNFVEINAETLKELSQIHQRQ
jgi:transcriptional regulator with XRE-family HTH domain